MEARSRKNELGVAAPAGRKAPWRAVVLATEGGFGDDPPLLVRVAGALDEAAAWTEAELDAALHRAAALSLVPHAEARSQASNPDLSVGLPRWMVLSWCGSAALRRTARREGWS